MHWKSGEWDKRRKLLKNRRGTVWSREAVGDWRSHQTCTKGQEKETGKCLGGKKSSLPLQLVPPWQCKKISWASAPCYAEQMACQTLLLGPSSHISFATPGSGPSVDQPGYLTAQVKEHALVCPVLPKSSQGIAYMLKVKSHFSPDT